jgi:hypothetical protein
MDKFTPAYLAALQPHYRRQIAAGVAKAFDTCYCPQCGDRRKSQGEAYQVERDEICLYACSTVTAYIPPYSNDESRVAAV